VTREQLIALVEKLISNQGTEEEDEEWLAILAQNAPHPEVSDLIYWNEEEPIRRRDRRPGPGMASH
jgi:hypothetical protein